MEHANTPAVVIDPNPTSRGWAEQALTRAHVRAIASGDDIDLLPDVGGVDPEWVLIAAVPARSLERTLTSVRQRYPGARVLLYDAQYSLALRRAALLYGVESFGDYASIPGLLGEARNDPPPCIARQRSGVASVMSIIGGSTRAGTSTVAAAVAIMLRRRTNGAVLLIGLTPVLNAMTTEDRGRATYTTADFATVADRIARSRFLEALEWHDSGVAVIGTPGEITAPEGPRPADMEALVGQAARLFDYVVLEVPALPGPQALAVIRVSKTALLVHSGEFIDVGHAARTLDQLQTAGLDDAQVRLVLNRAAADRSFAARDISTVLGKEIDWLLPFDAGIEKRGLRPQDTSGVFWEAISRLTESLVGPPATPAMVRSIAEPPSRGGRSRPQWGWGWLRARPWRVRGTSAPDSEFDRAAVAPSDHAQRTDEPPLAPSPTRLEDKRPDSDAASGFTPPPASTGVIADVQDDAPEFELSDPGASDDPPPAEASAEPPAEASAEPGRGPALRSLRLAPAGLGALGGTLKRRGGRRLVDAIGSARGGLSFPGSQAQETAREDHADLNVAAAQRIARLADAAHERRRGVETTPGEAAEVKDEARNTLGPLPTEEMEESDD